MFSKDAQDRSALRWNWLLWRRERQENKPQGEYAVQEQVAEETKEAAESEKALNDILDMYEFTVSFYSENIRDLYNPLHKCQIS
jgi:hypothetical protein